MHYGAEHTYGARADDSWTYRGLKTVVIENETLRAVVLADKGADVLSLVHKPSDTDFLWRSPWGVRDPRTYVPATGDPTGVWIDSYHGGWQTVLPAGGGGGAYRNADLGMHGEANLLPWDAQVLSEGPQRAAVQFTVRLPRTPLVVTKTIAVEQGKPTMTFRESVTNVGGEPVDLSYGQHITFGAPFLSEACLIDLPGGTVTQGQPYSPNHRLMAGASQEWPKGVLLDGSEINLREIPPPGTGCEDMAYITDLPAGWYAVTNTALGVGAAVRYPADLYPNLWYWQVFSGGAGYPWWGQTYNIGLEPFTSASNAGLGAAVEDGSARVIGPGETIDSELHFSAYRSFLGVADVAADGTVTTL